MPAISICLTPSAKSSSSAASVGAVAAVGLQDLVVHLDRRVDVAQVLLVELPEAELQRDDLVVVLRQTDLATQDVGQLAPALGLLIEAIEREDGVAVLRLRVDDAAIGGDGALGLPELLFVDARHAQQHVDLPRHFEELAELGLVRAPPARPTPWSASASRSRWPSVTSLLRVLLERLAVRLERVHRRLEATLVVVGDAVQQLDAAHRIVGVAHHHVEDVDEPLPLAGRLEDRLEHLRRQHRLLRRRARGRRAPRASARACRRS